MPQFGTEQVWSALRAQGIRTPDVAAWQRVPPPPNTPANTDRSTLAYPMVVDLYNAPQFQQVALRLCGHNASDATHVLHNLTADQRSDAHLTLAFWWE